MPGLSLVYNSERRRAAADALAAAQAATVHDERYVTRVLSGDDGHVLCFSGYAEYPIGSFDLGKYIAHVEGRILGADEATVAARLAELPDLMIGDRQRELAEWLVATNGDFVIYVLDRPGGPIGIVNDVLGRLPLYWRQAVEGFFLSRDLRFIAKLMPRVRFDRMAIAQHLLVGYPVAGRTLLEGVARLDGATFIRFDRDTARLTPLRPLNLEPKTRASCSTAENGAVLAELFTLACARQSWLGHHNVVSLSGGFDSRAIAAGLHAAGVPFSCATFVDHAGNAAGDVQPAERLAKLFGSPWKLERLGPPRASDILKLLRMKSGMSSLGMSFLLPFLASVRDEWGPALQLSTGELGFTLLEPAAAVALRQARDLVDYLIAYGQRLPLEVVARLTMLDEADIVSELERVILAHPEPELEQKLAHFVFVERALRWQLEAEDRNRCYFWTTTPFSDNDFVRAAMNCPDDQKRLYGLYRAFLVALSPAAAAIEHAGIGTPITSERFGVDVKVAALLARDPSAAARLKSALAPPATYRPDSRVIRWMSTQITSCALLADVLAKPALEEMLMRCSEYSWDRLDLLFTVTAAIEDLGTGRSVLE